MTTVDTKPACGRVTLRSSPTPAERETLHDLKQRFERSPACFFCRKNSSQVTFVITDPAVCESCADECVRRFACTCVC